MANRHRGEIDAVLDGVPHRLVLTLGALAELESVFGDDDMLALIGRFERGRLSARDCMRIIGAGLRGSGAAVSDADVAKMRVDGGATGYVDIVARLLAATFGSDDASSPESSEFGGGGAARTADPDAKDRNAQQPGAHSEYDANIAGGGASARAPFLGPT